MASIRIGFSSDFVLKNGVVGLGTTVGSTTDGKLELDNGALRANLSVSGVATLTAYGGFVAQQQHVNKPAAIGFSTSGIGSFQQYYETETEFTDLGGVHHGDDQYFNTLSEDLVIDDGQILNITNTEMVGFTTIGEYDPHTHESYVCAGSLEQVSVTGHFSVPNGGTNDRQETPIEGTVRFNDDLATLEFFNGNEWRQFTYNQGQSGRGVFPPGVTPADSELIDYVTISSLGNALNFGDLTHERRNCASCSSSIRGLIAGGFTSPATSDEILYITLASEGDAIDFGTLTNQKSGFAAAASSTRGLFADNTGPLGQIERVEIGTLGNAIDFGDLSFDRAEQGALSSPTRMVIGGGGAPSGTAPSNIMDFIIISSGGQAVDFGDLVDRHGQLGAGFGNSTRGFFAGGLRNPVNLKIIQYITIASEGNAIFFGDLEIGRSEQPGAASNSTRGVVAGGNPTTNSIEYITISTASDAIDFGDLAVPKQRLGGGQMSDSHGGLGGF